MRCGSGPPMLLVMSRGPTRRVPACWRPRCVGPAPPGMQIARRICWVIRTSVLSTSTLAACTWQDRLWIAARFASECGSILLCVGGDHLVPAARLAVKVARGHRPPAYPQTVTSPAMMPPAPGNPTVAATGEFSPRGRLRAAGSLLVRTLRCRTGSPSPRRP